MVFDSGRCDTDRLRTGAVPGHGRQDRRNRDRILIEFSESPSGDRTRPAISFAIGRDDRLNWHDQEPSKHAS